MRLRVSVGVKFAICWWSESDRLSGGPKSLLPIYDHDLVCMVSLKYLICQLYQELICGLILKMILQFVPPNSLNVNIIIQSNFHRSMSV